jgi:hypothetical protein
MPSITLTESSKLSQDQLVAGVIEEIITVNNFYEVLPFDGIQGNALSYNRENVLGDVQTAAVGDTITAKNPATFTTVRTGLTTILGDTEINGLIQSTQSNIVDQRATQISSKAKNVGRKFQDLFVNGSGVGSEFTGLLGLVDSGQLVDSGTNGSNLTFELIDELIDRILDKDGMVDFLMFPRRTLRSYLALLRALGGATIGDVATLPSGNKIPAYRGIPIFANDYIPTNQTKGTATTCTTIFAGTVDDGSRTHGIAGLTSEKDSGMKIKRIGESHTKDEEIWRVLWYCGLALFNKKGLAAIPGIKN